MGTRSLTFVKDGDLKSKNTICMYRQFDGYPSGHGVELAEFLAGYVIINGIGSNLPKKCANGMDCLSAQIVAHFKNKSPLGGIYLCPTDTKDAGQEYEYTVFLPLGATEPHIQVKSLYDKNRILAVYSATKFAEWALGLG
jgi:hypothetical protein